MGGGHNPRLARGYTEGLREDKSFHWRSSKLLVGCRERGNGTLGGFPASGNGVGFACFPAKALRHRGGEEAACTVAQLQFGFEEYRSTARHIKGQRIGFLEGNARPQHAGAVSEKLRLWAELGG